MHQITYTIENKRKLKVKQKRMRKKNNKGNFPLPFAYLAQAHKSTALLTKLTQKSCKQLEKENEHSNETIRERAHGVVNCSL